jgi:hypothetical protein
MPESFYQHADELRTRAALETDAGRRRYLCGLARSYAEMARLRGEPEPLKRPERPTSLATAERANLVALLRGSGYSQYRIAAQLGCSQQTISKVLLAGRYR